MNSIPIRIYSPGAMAVTVRKGTVAGVHQTAEVIQTYPNIPTKGQTTDLSMPTENALMLSAEERLRLAQLLHTYGDVFSSGPGDLGRTSLVQHDIQTMPDPPMKQPPCRMAWEKQLNADEQIQPSLQSGLARQRQSSWALPIVMDTLDTLSTARWFSTLDLVSGYWQVELTPRARKAVAFCIRKGLCEWNVMPFGLCNAPLRLMDRVMAGMQWETCLVWCVWGMLFRDMGSPLIQVQEWPQYSNISEVRQFVGLALYYRRFAKDFATIAELRHALTRKYAHFRWTEDCQQAFVELKQELNSTPVLAYPLDTGHLILYTDASDFGIGAVLSQMQDGEERVLAYGS
ncbi:hypothetical protein NFI96_015279 [Prochilodus magdalenae]|nr:hypothetical protein NFI96_015279 [Prochilodus magdalenae]